MKQHLARFSLFIGLKDDELAQIAELLETPAHYAKGAVIYRSDAFRRAIGLIVFGKVTVQKQTLMMNRLGPGDMFGAAALFDAPETYVTQITAEESTQVIFLPQDVMSSLLLRYPVLAENYIRFLSERIRFLNRKLAVLTTGSAENRLYQYLLAHSDGQGAVQMPPSMVELAHTLNIGRSSLYRSLDALLDAGVLAREGRSYRLIK